MRLFEFFHLRSFSPFLAHFSAGTRFIGTAMRLVPAEKWSQKWLKNSFGGKIQITSKKSVNFEAEKQNPK